MLLIENATVYTPSTCLDSGQVLIDRGHILAVGAAGQMNVPSRVPRMDAHGLCVTPGWVDLQINGGFGYDFTQHPDSIWSVAQHLPRYGVTAFLPTIISSPLSQIESALNVWRSGPPAGFAGAYPLGWHVEGPFVNPKRRGAHNPIHLAQPTLEAVRSWSPSNGVRLVTLAPELDGAAEVIRYLSQAGVLVSAGHSMATYEQALAAFQQGITYGTHLFNAMPLLEHRSPGLAGALLTCDHVTTGLIADGVHVHPAMVELAWRMKGPHRLNLVTDASAALGMPPGEYYLGDLKIHVDSTSARLADGTLAGGVTDLSSSVRNLMRITRCSLAQALCTVTLVPSEALKLADRGRLAPGCRADIVFLSRDHEVVMTLIGGKPVFGFEVLQDRLQACEECIDEPGT